MYPNMDHTRESYFDSFHQTPHGELKNSYYNPFMVKHRRRTSKMQLKVLEKTFETNVRPDAALRKVLSEQLGMTPRSVQVWFQNRRAKVKKGNKVDEQPKKTAARYDQQQDAGLYKRPDSVGSKFGSNFIEEVADKNSNDGSDSDSEFKHNPQKYMNCYSNINQQSNTQRAEKPCAIGQTQDMPFGIKTDSGLSHSIESLQSHQETAVSQSNLYRSMQPSYSQTLSYHQLQPTLSGHNSASTTQNSAPVNYSKGYQSQNSQMFNNQYNYPANTAFFPNTFPDNSNFSYNLDHINNNHSNNMFYKNYDEDNIYNNYINEHSNFYDYNNLEFLKQKNVLGQNLQEYHKNSDSLTMYQSLEINNQPEKKFSGNYKMNTNSFYDLEYEMGINGEDYKIDQKDTRDEDKAYVDRTNKNYMIETFEDEVNSIAEDELSANSDSQISTNAMNATNTQNNYNASGDIIAEENDIKCIISPLSTLSSPQKKDGDVE